MATVSLNVISLATALRYLDADYNKVLRLLVEGVVKCSVVDGEFALDEEQYELLEREVNERGLRVSDNSRDLTVYELQNFCLSKGYINNEKTFNHYLKSGLFSNFKTVRPFSNTVTYKYEVLVHIVIAVKNGGIVTLKHGGYTKSAIQKDFNLTEQQFVDLTVRMNIKPKTFDSVPVYTKDDYLTIKLLSNRVKSVNLSEDSSKTGDGKILNFDGKDYISKANVREYLGTKHSTVTYLNNLGVIKYKDIVYKEGIVTATLQEELDTIKSYITKGYQPAVISLLLSGFLTEEEFSNYVLENQFLSFVGQIEGIDDKLKANLNKVYEADIVVQGVRIYKKKTLTDFVKRYVRGTHLIKNISTDFITTSKLVSLIGKTPKNIRSYAIRYLDGENDIIRTKNGICIRLSSYMDLQGSSDIEQLLIKQEEQYKNRMNFAM